MWLKFPSQEVDANTMTEAVFGQDVTKRELVGVLIYKPQRKRSLESNADNTSKEGPSTNVRLLIIWEPNDWYGFSVRALLIKHSDTITWNEDKLRWLYSIRHVLFKKCPHDVSDWFEKGLFIEDTWLLDDTTALMTTSKWKKDSCVFEIIISEETREYNCMKPLEVPLKV
jgi:hypothetical protein